MVRKISLRITLVTLLIDISACSKAKPSHSPLERAPSMDMGQMNGDWHVVARIPTILDREATDMHMTFLVRQDFSMDIDWLFKKNSKTEADTKYSLSGQAGRARDTTLWSISPFWPLSFTYQVLEFSGDYSWIVVGSSDRKYLWILSRNDNMDPLLIEGLLRRVEDSKFDVSAVVKQSKSEPSKQ